MKVRKAKGDLGVDDLVAAEWNPRQISQEALEGLRHSIKSFGDISGLVFNIRTGRMLCGHQRLKGLKEEYGDDLIPICQQDGEGNLVSMVLVTPDGKRFPVRLVDWDDTMSIAANLAANNPLIAGEFTEDTETLADRVAQEDPILARTTRVGELFLPTLPRPEPSQLADTAALEAEPQPDQPKLDRNYLYIQWYGKPAEFEAITERLKAAGIMEGPHELNHQWFEETVRATLDGHSSPEGEGQTKSSRPPLRASGHLLGVRIVRRKGEDL